MLNKKRQRFLLPLAKIAISILLLWLLIHSAQIKMDLFATLIQQPILFFEVILLFLLMIVIGAWRWYILNSAQGIHLGFYKSVFATYVGAAFNNLLPSGVGGDVVRLSYVFKQAPQKKNEAVLTVFSDRVLGFLAIFITICFVGIANIHFISHQPRVFYLFLFCAAFCIGTLTIFILCIWLSNRIQLSAWLYKRLGNHSWSKPIISFFETLSIFRVEKMVVVKGLMISVVVQLLMTVAITMIANMMGLPAVAFSSYIIAMGITQIVNLIPLTPGGVGVGEIAFANILLILNPGANAAYATVLLAYRLISMLAYLPGVIGFIPKFASVATDLDTAQ